MVVYVFNWSLQAYVDGTDDQPTLESLARPAFSSVVVAESKDQETDEAFWRALSKTKTDVAAAYFNTLDNTTNVKLRWEDVGLHRQGDFLPERTCFLFDNKELVAMVTVVIASTS